MQQVRKVLITRAEEVGNTLLDDLIGCWPRKVPKPKLLLEEYSVLGEQHVDASMNSG